MLNSVLDQALKALALVIKDVKAAPVSEEEIPDAAGRIRKAETDLQTHRLAMTRELGPGTTAGDDYVVEVHRERRRSFNWPAIAADYMRARDVDLIAALELLEEAGVLELRFGWQKLEQHFATHGIGLRIANHELGPDEIGDTAAAHVGQWWKDKAPTVKARTSEET